MSQEIGFRVTEALFRPLRACGRRGSEDSIGQVTFGSAGVFPNRARPMNPAQSVASTNEDAVDLVHRIVKLARQVRAMTGSLGRALDDPSEFDGRLRELAATYQVDEATVHRVVRRELRGRAKDDGS